MSATVMDLKGGLQSLLQLRTRRALAFELRRALRRAGVAFNVTADDQIAIEHAGNSGRSTIFLGNLLKDFAGCNASDRSRFADRVVKGLQQAMESSPSDYVEVRKSLYPLLAGNSSVALHSLALQSAGAVDANQDLVVAPVVADISMMLGVGAEDSVMLVNKFIMARWGISFQQAAADALINLRDGASQDGWVEVAQGVWKGTWSDPFGSARALLPDLIHRVGPNTPVVMVPFRDSVYVASRGSTEAQLRLVASVKESMSSSPRWISFRLMEYVDRQLVPYQPAAAVVESLKELEMTGLASDYAEQSRSLGVILRKQCDTAHVAAQRLMRRSNGSPASYAIWCEGVDTLLPISDYVVFSSCTQGHSDMFLVEWRDVEEKFGYLLERCPYQPPRVRVRASPSRAQVVQVGKSVKFDEEVF